ncbi:condensation domain-containing protein [Actinoplanes xinjiangensis]|uniref:Condensation domain-containing protein n=1 Tax=Actinoplanes xinjiangensis TaxID=512350 RepID=A0A316EY02_9ACTN|nr:condensation domain-containing protein [Actinoplanes xinjiangensis]PWK36083.1 condensation domain-containing protein [Actinoplanes xinjiangensis]
METVGIRQIVATGERSGDAPATWGQRYMWDIVQALAPADEHLNVPIVVPVPSGHTLDEVLAAIEVMIAAHESFRTRYAVEDGRLRQWFAGSEPIPVTLYRSTEVDLRAAASALAKRIAGQRFALDTDLPTRAAVLLHNDVPAAVVLVISHIVADGWAISMIAPTLRRILREGRGGTGPAPVQLVEQAAYEQSEAGARQNQRALAYWRRMLEQFPAVYPGDGERPAAAPRYWQGALRTPRGFTAARQLAEAAQVSVPTVLLTAFCQVLGTTTGLSQVPLIIRASNRMRPETTDVIGHFSEAVPILIDVTGKNFTQVLRHAHVRALSAYRYGHHYPPDVIDLQRAIAAERGTDVAMRVALNNPYVAPRGAFEVAPEHDPAGRQHSEFVWMDKRETEAITAYANVWPEAHMFSIFADTTFLDPAAIENSHWQLEKVLVQAAAAQR